MPTSDERTATEAPLLSPPLPDDHRYLSRGVSRGGGAGRGGRQGGRGKPAASPRVVHDFSAYTSEWSIVPKSMSNVLLFS